MGTRRPLTTTAVAAGIGTVIALTLGPMASAATSTAERHDLRPASAAAAPAAQSARTVPGTVSGGSGSGLSLADTGVDTVPYAVSGLGSLIVGVGLVCAARRFAS
ncbi:hypothetical protein GXW83_04260 [Streptacidiphilus sp. PB12-B1b]|uniref:hypothetical protein n=1 Tax=Streptacidiphilus sp. PB12-B1b TaxID=2705012 RepID=UPI0015FA1BEE|nr:hypothetical protein [Streptacidiphilus sp. PB12-B1b]QMU75088.1 hypothetical protein GXW83_04260 [Streptacidiphilus sp. PB12-B1b]